VHEWVFRKSYFLQILLAFDFHFNGSLSLHLQETVDIVDNISID